MMVATLVQRLASRQPLPPRTQSTLQPRPDLRCSCSPRESVREMTPAIPAVTLLAVNRPLAGVAVMDGRVQCHWDWHCAHSSLRTSKLAKLRC